MGGALRAQQQQTDIPLSREEILRQSFQLAAKSHSDGDLLEAEKLYRAILAVEPSHADALHGLGVVAYQTGRANIAEMLIRHALSQRETPTFDNNLALVLLALDRPHEALACVRRALDARPDYPEAWHALGNVRQKLGQRDEAIEAYDKALILRPAYGDAWANLAKLRLEAGAFDAAREACRAALAANPGCAEAHNTLGNVLRARGEYQGAAESFDRALNLHPNYPEAWNNKAVVLLMLQKTDEAAACVRRALALKPDFGVGWATYGSALVAVGNLNQAIASFEKSVAYEPNCVEAHNNLGATLLQLDRADEAIAAFEKAIALSEAEGRAESHYNLGTTLIERNQLDRAVLCLGKAIAADPNHAAARNNLGIALQGQGAPAEAVQAYGEAIDADPHYAGAYCNKLMAMHYIEKYSNEDMLDVARAFGRAFDRPDKRPFAARDPSPERRLRIGYVSGDFNSHPVAFFFARSLRAHDREQVEIFCYSNWASEDFMTEELRGLSDHWRVVAGMSDAEAADLIRQDEIDILVDLAGHTNKTRVVLFGLKPAPIEVEWIGYFGTTGLPSMDYLMLDPVSAPEGADRWYVERLVRLPYGRFCYKPPAFEIPVADPPSLTKGFVTFGCFNNVAKLSAGALDLWAEILRATPEARLVLKWKSMSEESVRRRLRESFTSRGVAESRVELRGQSSYEQMLREYNDIDIALDPFPFGGATTSCEALWMGVPVMTWPGDRLASRQTLGFLVEMGFAELAAASREDYVARAVALAKDKARLRDIRHALRPAMEAAAFCDGPRFTRTLEQAYRIMWRRYAAGEAPAPIEIPRG
jgi:predicted O-linked N-acetylglucosamine transferase (SPINDLY family)